MNIVASGTTAAHTVPDHVPAELVYDFNLYDFPVQDGDAQRALLALRERGAPEIFWSPYNGGHWMVTRAPAVLALLNDADRFSSRYIGVPKEFNPVRLFRPLQIDPPDTIHYRRFIMAALTPKVARTLKDDARALTISLIESFRDRGECEFVTEFAQHMPIQIFLSLLKLPETDRVVLLEIAETITRPKFEEDRMRGYDMLETYATALIEERTGRGDEDFVARIAAADIQGRPLTLEEQIGVISVMIIAGLDTVAAMLTYFARYFAREPARAAELRDNPALIPNAIEELVRRFAQVNVAREVREDLVLEGVAMRRGDMAVGALALHNLDEAKFDEPLKVDFERPRNPQHVSFGGQVHHCLGAALARVELQVFLEEWLTRIPLYRVADGVELGSRQRVNITVPRLPLAW